MYKCKKNCCFITVCKAHSKVTHKKQQIYFPHLKRPGYNTEFLLYPRPFRWWKYICCFMCVTLLWALHIVIKQQFITRHSLVRAMGEVFVLLYVCFFCFLFGQRFLDNPRAACSLHADVLWFWMCLLPFWGLAASGGRKKGQIKFSLLWESMGNFCILAVFERYLNNACTDPHQILFM